MTNITQFPPRDTGPFTGPLPRAVLRPIPNLDPKPFRLPKIVRDFALAVAVLLGAWMIGVLT